MSADGQIIPEDIQREAEQVIARAQSLITVETIEQVLDGQKMIRDVYVAEIAKAILAERERCVAEMDNFIEHVTVSVDGRSRFDIYDLNRECKKSVRYVRDRLTGQSDKYWSEEPLSDAPKAEA